MSTYISYIYIYDIHVICGSMSIVFVNTGLANTEPLLLKGHRGFVLKTSGHIFPDQSSTHSLVVCFFVKTSYLI